MTSADEKVRAGIYCRLSLAVLDDTTKVDDQERICRDLARGLGWDVADVYSDNNRSAWQPSRKRPQWERMLGDVESGRINAIVVYHGDRLLRTHEDLLALIKLARTRGVKLASPAGTRDLGNYDDQFILEIEASMAKRESANTSRRRKAQYDRWRREGRVRPGGRGGRAYGFATDGVTLIPEEVELIQEAARRVLAGETTGSIARDLSARGARTPTGAEFTHGTLRKMLARPRYAGLMPDGVSSAAWEPVLERADWEAVCAALEAKAAGFAYATNARTWLLSGIACCGECGSPLQIRTDHSPKVTGYGCVKPGCRKVQRSAAHLDAYVSAATVARLANPANPAANVPAAPALAAEFRQLAAQRAEVAARLADPAYPHLELMERRLTAIDARLEQLRELSAPSAAARLMGSHQGLSRREWDGLPLATRRALVQACWEVTVLRASKRGPGFNTDDVRLERR